MQEEIDKVIKVLRSGGLILYPTDTVWGIGCDATNKDAVEKINALKKSWTKQGMIVLTDDLYKCFRRVPFIAENLLECADKPLTLILSDPSGVADSLVADDGTLGVRIPKHDFCLMLIRKLGRPIVSTSANISGEPTPMKFEDIDPQIKEKVDHVVDKRYEGKPTRSASSIIKLGRDCEIEIIRK